MSLVSELHLFAKRSTFRYYLRFVVEHVGPRKPAC